MKTHGSFKKGTDMNKRKLKKTIFAAMIVSIGSQLYIDVFIDGFILALSVAILAVFLYCYEDLHPAQITILAGVFSPLFRLGVLIIQGSPVEAAALRAVPDMVFFAWYGILYCLIFQVFHLLPKNMKTFPVVIAICDFSANMAEILVRQALYHADILSIRLMGMLLLVAFARTCLIQVIIVAIESYSSFLVREEHNKEYKRLVVLTSIFESEVYLMNKNAESIERIMKKAFSLYKALEKLDTPPKYKEISLDISKDAHEIKNDYLRAISVLKETFMAEKEENAMSIRDLIFILKADINNQIRVANRKIEFISSIKHDFIVSHHFELMSILRNLVINSMEAIGNQKGQITLTVLEQQDFHVILIRDTGPGIDLKNIDFIFEPGFSTKFNEATGDIGRGVGLSLVKDYVEDIFHGTICVNSQKGSFTEFEIKIPVSQEADGQ